VLLRFLRRLGDYWPQLAITLGSIGFAAVGILLSPPDQGFSWLVTSTPGLVFVCAAVLTLAGSLVVWKRTPGVLSLRGRVAELEALLERAERDYYDQFAVELSVILKDVLGYGDTERISVYRHRGGAFQMIGRYSDNPVYRSRGRSIYPDDEGIIGRAWREESATANLPDPDTEPDLYYEALKNEWNIDRGTAEEFTMRSRSYVTKALYEPKGVDRVAIVVVESTEAGILDRDEVLRAMETTEGKRIYQFLERKQSLEPDPRYAREEGF
jgi:hypothetical protein